MFDFQAHAAYFSLHDFSLAMKWTGLTAAIILVLFAASPLTSAQRNNGKKDPGTIFSDVQRGISESNVADFSLHFHSQVHVTLRGGESGLYSANQAYYILQNYFHDRKPVKFSFTTFSSSDMNPYATGGAAFNIRGGRERCQVYVALASYGGRWVITHINIY